MPPSFGQHIHTTPWERRHRWLARVGGVLIVAAGGALLSLEPKREDGSHTPRPVMELFLVADAPGDHLPPLSAPPVPVRPAEFAPPGIDGAPGDIVDEAQLVGEVVEPGGRPESIAPEGQQEETPALPSALPPLGPDGDVLVRRDDGAARAARTGLLSRSGFQAGQVRRVQEQRDRIDNAKASPYDEDGGLRVIKRVSPRYNHAYMHGQPLVHECLYDVQVTPAGVPEDIRVLQCPQQLQAEGARAVARWRWVERSDEYHRVQVRVLLRFHPPERAGLP